MIEWHDGEPPKQGRFLMIARTTDSGSEIYDWEMVVGHWHEVQSAYVPTALAFDLRQETPVPLRPLDDRDTRG
jgi:hypothetical protein